MSFNRCRKVSFATVHWKVSFAFWRHLSSICKSRSYLAHQQRAGGGAGDEIEADQATNVWEGRISSLAQAGTSCGVADSWSMLEAVQAVWSVLCVAVWERVADR
jgi:hypothetical protein